MTDPDGNFYPNTLLNSLHSIMLLQYCIIPNTIRKLIIIELILYGKNCYLIFTLWNQNNYVHTTKSAADQLRMHVWYVLYTGVIICFNDFPSYNLMYGNQQINNLYLQVFNFILST